MSFGRPTFTSKFVGTYAQLFQGLSPHEITPQEDEGQFYQNLLNLDVKREYLQGEFERITKGDCLGRLKVRPFQIPCSLENSVTYQVFSSPS